MNPNAVCSLLICFNFVPNSIDGSAVNRAPTTDLNTDLNSNGELKIRTQYVMDFLHKPICRADRLTSHINLTEYLKMFKTLIPRVNQFKIFESWKPDSITGDVWSVIVGFLLVEEAINLENAFSNIAHRPPPRYVSTLSNGLYTGFSERASQNYITAWQIMRTNGFVTMTDLRQRITSCAPIHLKSFEN
jgi:hypothetical protein